MVLQGCYTRAMPKYYTPKEANETLIMVRPMIEELMRIAEKVRAHQPELWVMVQKSAGNGGNPELSKLLKDFDRLDELIHKVQDMGIQIKDLVIGLIDFPAWHEGRKCIFAGRLEKGILNIGTRSKRVFQAAS